MARQRRPTHFGPIRGGSAQLRPVLAGLIETRPRSLAWRFTDDDVQNRERPQGRQTHLMATGANHQHLDGTPALPRRPAPTGNRSQAGLCQQPRLHHCSNRPRDPLLSVAQVLQARRPKDAVEPTRTVRSSTTACRSECQRMGLILDLSRLLVTAVTAALLVGCASAPTRVQPLPEALSTHAQIPGIPGARYWGDIQPPGFDAWLKLARRRARGQLQRRHESPAPLPVAVGRRRRRRLRRGHPGRLDGARHTTGVHHRHRHQHRRTDRAVRLSGAPSTTRCFASCTPNCRPRT